ncbi:MAG: winged helix-turn-helix transcriptional regulator [Promethearchaeia archaeon]
MKVYSQKKTLTRNGFEMQILKFLKANSDGSTVTDIANGIGASRNTIAKYLSKLEESNAISSKKVGAYTLYYGTDKNQIISKSIFISLYKGLIYGLKKQFPREENKVKELGKYVAEFFEIPLIGFEKFVDYLKNDEPPSLEVIVRLLEQFNVYNELFDENTILSGVQVIEPKKSYSFRYSNFSLLQEKKDFSYHLEIIGGYVEGLLSKKLRRKVSCRMTDCNVGDTPETTYVDGILEFE